MENYKRKSIISVLKKDALIQQIFTSALCFFHMPGTVQVGERKNNLYYLLKQEE